VTAGPVSAVLAGATARERLRPADARAGADYERVVADGQAYFLKRLSPATDWIMRLTGDHVRPLVHERPDAVTGPLNLTPLTFLQGDWKMGNLGSHPDGRTILLDWAYPGSGPACWDLCWYLALNRARIPEPKEAAIGRFRAALEARGVATDPWWDTQLDLCLIGIMATFGWEKALGDQAELDWWQDRVARAAARRGIIAGR